MKPNLPIDSSQITQGTAQQLEQLIDRVCQAQPILPAPKSLHAKVMAEVQRRAALPWWRKSFVYWPMAARAAFLVGSLGIAQLTLTLLARFNAQPYATELVDSVAEPVSWLQSVGSFISLLNYSVALVIGRIPTLWLYGGALAIAMLYAAVLGLGAAAYRTLYISR